MLDGLRKPVSNSDRKQGLTQGLLHIATTISLGIRCGGETVMRNETTSETECLSEMQDVTNKLSTAEFSVTFGTLTEP